VRSKLFFYVDFYNAETLTHIWFFVINFNLLKTNIRAFFVAEMHVIMAQLESESQSFMQGQF